MNDREWFERLREVLASPPERVDYEVAVDYIENHLGLGELRLVEAARLAVLEGKEALWDNRHHTAELAAEAEGLAMDLEGFTDQAFTGGADAADLARLDALIEGARIERRAMREAMDRIGAPSLQDAADPISINIDPLDNLRESMRRFTDAAQDMGPSLGKATQEAASAGAQLVENLRAANLQPPASWMRPESASADLAEEVSRNVLDNLARMGLVATPFTRNDSDP